MANSINKRKACGGVWGGEPGPNKERVRRREKGSKMTGRRETMGGGVVSRRNGLGGHMLLMSWGDSSKERRVDGQLTVVREDNNRDRKPDGKLG